MSPSHSSAKPAVHGAWVAVIAAFITYGSLYPFQFVAPVSWTEARATFLNGPRWWTSLSDVVGNALLFLPLGLVISAGLPPAHRTPLRLIAITMLGIGFALLLQVAQILVPTRLAALSDVFWNMVGFVAGIGFGQAVDRLRVTAKVRHFQPGMPHLLVLFWLAAELAPLVPAFDWQGAKDALRSLRTVNSFDWSVALASAARTLALGTILSTMSDKRKAVWLLAATVLAAVFLKPLIVGQSLTVEDLAGYSLGFAGWLLASRWMREGLDGIAATLLLVAYSIDELRPFSLNVSPTSMNWIPFSAILTTMTSGSLSSLFRSLFTFATIGWVVCRAGGMLMPTTVVIAIWVGAFEAAQMWIVGRTADITESVLVVVAGAMVALFARWQDSALPSPPPLAGVCKQSPPASFHTATERRPAYRFAALLALWAAATYAIAALLRMPGIPYNVPEMFLGSGHAAFLAIFVFAVFWVGAGSAWLAARLPMSRLPILAWPAYAFAAAMISLGLLYASVTDARIEKISGSNNLWWFVTNKDIWGVFAHWLFAVVGQDVVSILERPVRYAALYIPVPVFIAVALMLSARGEDLRPTRRQLAMTVLSALPLLWLCKGIAFDWSSTDNLNELIARDGEYGWGGGGYLYLLLAVFAANVALLTRVPIRFLGIVTAVMATGFAVVVGWEVLNLGLEPHVEKYGQIFSGAQFLLGPDRKHTLSNAELFARWIVVYLPAVILISAGSRIGWPLLSRFPLPGRFLERRAVPSEGK